MLKEETKIFYRNLGMENRVAREPTSRGKVEPYWKLLLVEEAQLNDRTDCI